jgi:outer membrane receptor protein involved in Fe transport
MNSTKAARRFCTMAAMFALMAIGVPNLSAQSTTAGGIGGNVVDQSRGALPGATVTARNVETNSSVSTVSDQGGRFTLSALNPGTYSVEVSLSGFATYKQDSVAVEVGRVTSIEAALGLSGQAETIVVVAEWPVVNTIEADFSTNINQTTIANLPTNTRRWSTFALMTPGAAPDGTFGLVSFRGISGLLNGNTVDGGDNTQAFFAEERGRTRLAYSLSNDAVQEFQVTTSNYSAEYGRAAGGVVNAVTKSGTNNFRGTGFYFIRDNKLGAKNPFQTQTVVQNGVNTTVQLKPKDRRQQFGGVIGGPIKPDKLFFFFSYDEQNRKFPGVAAPSNPGAFFAPFSAAEQAVFASRNISAAQQAEGVAFLQGLTGEVPRTGNQRLFLPKLDWTINNNHSLAVTYNRLRWESPAGVQTAAVVFRGVESWGNDGVEGDWTIARLTSILGPRTINEARFQWGRDFEFQLAQPPLAGQPVSATGVAPAVDISGAGNFGFGKPNFLNRTAYPDERRTQFVDTLSVTRGAHSLKFGGEINHVSDTLDNLFQESGVYAYNSRVDFISDYINNTRTNNPVTRNYNAYNQNVGPSAFSFTTDDYAAFVQDAWSVNPSLTLNLGLRYDYQRMPDPQIANPLLPATGNFPKDKNNWGPRLGIAWNRRGEGTTVLRGGYGMFYGRIINSTISNAITTVGSTSGQLALQLTASQAGAPAYPAILSSASATPVRPDVVVFAPDTQNPLIYQYDAIFEHRIARNTMVSASYVGSRGKYLPLFIDTNLPAPSGTMTYQVIGGPLDGQPQTVPVFTGNRPDPNFSRITTISGVVESTYNGLVLQFNRRLTDGLQFQASYTEARATDNGQSSQTFTNANNVLNPYDLELEEGTSNFEIKHRFVANAIWMPTVGAPGTLTNKLLSGFTFSPTVMITSGVPYTATLTGNSPVAGRISTGVLGAGGTNRLPSIERNAYRLPETANVDLRIGRSFGLPSEHRIEVLADIFNVFNRLNYTSAQNQMYTVGGTAAAPTLTSIATFGSFNNANSNYFVFTPRQIQLAVRYTF